jgi:hypothetical protein
MLKQPRIEKLAVMRLLGTSARFPAVERPAAAISFVIAAMVGGWGRNSAAL